MFGALFARLRYALEALDRERRNAQEARQVTEKMFSEQYRLLFETNPQAAWICDMETLQFRAVNEAAVRLYGYLQGEFGKMTVKEVCPPEEASRLMERLAGSKAETWIGSTWRHRKKDKTMFEAEITVHPTMFRSRRACIMLITDVTAQRNAEEALRSSERRFRALIEQSRDGVALINENGIIRYASPSTTRILGYAVDELVNRNAFELVHPDEQALIQERFAAMLQRPGAGSPVQFRYRHKDGPWRWLETVGTNLLHDAPVAAIALNFADITERKEAGEQLRQAHKMEAIGQLAGGVAHDFNNLLMVIRGYCEMMIEGMASSDAFRPQAQHIQKAADRAADLVQQLPAFSRKQVLQPKILELNHILGEMEPMLRRLIGKDIELIVHREAGLGMATVYGIVKQSAGQICVYSEPEHGAVFKIYLPRVDEPVTTVKTPPPPDPKTLQGSERQAHPLNRRAEIAASHGRFIRECFPAGDVMD